MIDDADFSARVDALGTPFDGLDGIGPQDLRQMPPAQFEALFAPYRSLDDVPFRRPGDQVPDGDHLFARARGARRPILYLATGERGRTWASTGETDLDRAKVFFLVRHARARKRQQRGGSMSVDQIESLPVCRVLKRYAQTAFFGPVAPQRIHSVLTYESAMRRIARVFAGKRVADIGDDISDWYYRQRGCGPWSLCKDMWLLKHGLNEGLRLLGVRGYVVAFKNPPEAKPQKQQLSFSELEALMTAARGHYVDPATGTWATTVDPATGQTVLAKRHFNTVRGRRVFLRLIPFGVATGSRHTRMTSATYTNPAGPWLDVDNGIFWRDGKKATKTRKRGGPVLLTPPVWKETRVWRDEDSDGPNATIYPFHKTNGKPYCATGIPTSVWNGMVTDSGIGKKFCVRNMKDVFVDIAETEGLTRAQMANMLSTSEEVLERRYGADTNLTSQWMAAQKLGRRSNWKRSQKAIAAHLASVERARLMPKPKKVWPKRKPTGRPVGRPRTRSIGPKRPRGRPRKVRPE